MFNESKIELTEPMLNLLNRGLNFIILPYKLDITQTLVDFKRFERSIIWHEFWFGQENLEEKEKPIFKTQKNNLPKNYTVPQGLKTFLSGVKSEIMDPKNRTSVPCNIPPEEIAALKELIRLQKERIKTIKACDKGGGIIILDFDEYLRACYMHLTSKQTQADGAQQSRYELVNAFAVENAKDAIKNLINEGMNNKIITKVEYDAINPEDKDLARFYCNFKVHKDYEHKKAPKPRAIVSGSGSITENASLFVQKHIQEISYSHPSYLQDTPDFLREIEKINAGPELPDNSLLVSMDAIGLYDNIPNDEGIESLGEALEERKDPKVPTGFIQRMMEIILKWNLFEFHEATYLQKVGVAMGIHPAPNYADIFMARRVDNKILQIIEKFKNAYEANNPIMLLLLKRFLDDLFLILQGTTKQIHQLLEEFNKIHASIQFTMEHTSNDLEAKEDRCDCYPKESISFLDTSCKLKNGKI